MTSPSSRLALLACAGALLALGAPARADDHGDEGRRARPRSWREPSSLPRTSSPSLAPRSLPSPPAPAASGPAQPWARSWPLPQASTPRPAPRVELPRSDVPRTQVPPSAGVRPIQLPPAASAPAGWRSAPSSAPAGATPGSQAARHAGNLPTGLAQPRSPYLLPGAPYPRQQPAAQPAAAQPAAPVVATAGQPDPARPRTLPVPMPPAAGTPATSPGGPGLALGTPSWARRPEGLPQGPGGGTRVSPREDNSPRADRDTPRPRTLPVTPPAAGTEAGQPAQASAAPAPTWRPGGSLAPATPRAALPRTVTPVTQASGVRSGGTLVPATPRVPPAPEAPATLAATRSGVRTSGSGVHYGGTRTTSSGAGVRYGGFGSACPDGLHVHGSSWRRLYVRPLPRYLDPCLPVTVVNVWGFATCECPPVIVTPAPIFITPPPVVVVEPAPVIVLPPPALLPAPAPAVVLPPEAPEQALPQPMPEPSPALLPPAAPGATPQAPPAAQEAPAPEAPLTLSPDDEQALAQSLAAFAAEDYAGALATLEALAARVPALGQAWLGIAHAAFALERHERAAQALMQAALLGAFPRGYAFDPRVLYATPERFDERLGLLATRVAAEPLDADLHLVLAWLRMSLGQRDEARARLDTVLTLRPDDEAAPLLALALLPPLPPEAATPAAPADRSAPMPPAAPAAR